MCGAAIAYAIIYSTLPLFNKRMENSNIIMHTLKPNRYGLNALDGYMYIILYIYIYIYKYIVFTNDIKFNQDRFLEFDNIKS